MRIILYLIAQNNSVSGKTLAHVYRFSTYCNMAFLVAQGSRLRQELAQMAVVYSFVQMKKKYRSELLDVWIKNLAWVGIRNDSSSVTKSLNYISDCDQVLRRSAQLARGN